MDQQERLIEAMQRLRFTATEARLYMALVLQAPATGYELAARSGVPRSAIYATLKKMEERGHVRRVSESPARYVPMPPEQLCARLKSQYEQTIDGLSEGFATLPRTSRSTELWQVFGADEVRAELAQQISQAKQAVVASLWATEARELADAFAGAVSRKLDVHLFSFNALPDVGAQTWAAGIPEDALERYWPRRLVMVLDGVRMVVAELKSGEEPYAVISEEPALVAMASSNLVLDLTLHGQRFGVDVSCALRSLHAPMAPIDELLGVNA